MTSRLTAPSRLLVLLTLVVVALILLLASAVLAGNGDDVSTVEYRVERGDTLWGIASAHDPGGDVRARVYEIRRLNDLDDVIIHPGDILLIPIAG